VREYLVFRTWVEYLGCGGSLEYMKSSSTGSESVFISIAID
jgi:hypothetical protein